MPLALLRAKQPCERLESDLGRKLSSGQIATEFGFSKCSVRILSGIIIGPASFQKWRCFVQSCSQRAIATLCAWPPELLIKPNRFAARDYSVAIPPYTP
jgi:hypothetical protein